MRRFIHVVLYDVLLVIALITLLASCAGRSTDINPSFEQISESCDRTYPLWFFPISVSYAVKKEDFINPEARVFISVIDERLDKSMSCGRNEHPEDPMRIFKTAMAERLSKNGIIVTSDNENDASAIDLLVRQFNVHWTDAGAIAWFTGEVGYVARIKKNGEFVCEYSIYEKARVLNWDGVRSAAKALNEAFNKAIDRLEVSSCFSKLQK